MTIDIQQTLGEIVLNYPDTVQVMNKYKVDYCCNGDDTLEVALNKADIDNDVILNELIASIGAQKNENIIDWKKKSMNEVIGYILDIHHVFMKATLEELNYLMCKILKVHYKDHGEQLLKVHHLVGLLKSELEKDTFNHIHMENSVLFTMMDLQGGNS